MTDSNQYRSLFERNMANLFRKSGHGDFQYEVATIPYTLQCIYTCDFYFASNGLLIETKGLFDKDDRRKHLAIKSTYPNLDVRLVFYKDAPLINTKARKKKKDGTRGESMLYSDWCKQHNIKYSIGAPPASWFDEDLSHNKEILKGLKHDIK